MQTHNLCTVCANVAEQLAILPRLHDEFSYVLVAQVDLCPTDRRHVRIEAEQVEVLGGLLSVGESEEAGVPVDNASKVERDRLEGRSVRLDRQEVCVWRRRARCRSKQAVVRQGNGEVDRIRLVGGMPVQERDGLSMASCQQ